MHSSRIDNKNNKVPGAELRKEANPIVTHEPQKHKHNSIYHKSRIHKINNTFSLKHSLQQSYIYIKKIKLVKRFIKNKEKRGY